MSRTNSTFGLLQAVAAIAMLTILLWSVGFPSFRFAEAANVTSLSDTLSDSAPSIGSDHTLSFVTPTGIANGSTITLDFSDGPFVVGSTTFADIDVLDNVTPLNVAADCSGTEEIGAVFSGTTLTLSFCTGDGGAIGANGTTTIKIGLNATGGTHQLTNPAVGSYKINVTAGASDTGATRVAIINPVVVTASVDTTFSFTVAGVAATGSVNQAVITGSTTATSIPFGKLTAGSATTSAQQLTVATNASYGFAVTVQVDHQLLSSTGADVDGFDNGSYATTPIAWVPPSANINDENTWGHWGITTDDASLTNGLTDTFDVAGTGEKFVSASTSPVEVFRHNGPADGTTQNIGKAKVGYKVEISPLQEAGDDYNATLTYVATPVF